MRWIDFENKSPTDTDVPGWTPWTKADWKSWQNESARLLGELETLHKAGKIKQRNEFIDKHAAHWGKLKPWLFALSHGKCWFSEGRSICSHTDVEHFRPKKEALNLDQSSRDGYWWLAFDYSNYRASGTVPNRKKGGWFPLHEASLCSTYDCRCEESEVPYLLDPINADDTELMAFDEEGNAIAAPGASDWDKERVKVTVERLKLNDHDDFPSARRKVWQKMDFAIAAYLTAKARYDPKRNPSALKDMREKLKEIKRMTKADAELSSTALWCLKFRNNPDLMRLAA